MNGGVVVGVVGWFGSTAIGRKAGIIQVGLRGFEPPTHGLGNRCSIP